MTKHRIQLLPPLLVAVVAITFSLVDLDAVLVATPNGVITATNLAGFERPNVVATLTGQGIKMICVYIGDSQSDYEVTCADSNAGRWVDRRATQRGHPGALR